MVYDAYYGLWWVFIVLDDPGQVQSCGDSQRKWREAGAALPTPRWHSFLPQKLLSTRPTLTAKLNSDISASQTTAFAWLPRNQGSFWREWPQLSCNWRTRSRFGDSANPLWRKINFEDCADGRITAVGKNWVPSPSGSDPWRHKAKQLFSRKGQVPPSYLSNWLLIVLLLPQRRQAHSLGVQREVQWFTTL